MNQYFYIFWNEINQVYEVQYGPTFLPENFGSVSGFRYLEVSDPSSLLDLTWAGFPNYAFWKVIPTTTPPCSASQVMVTKYNLDIPNKLVITDKYVRDMTPDERIGYNKTFIDNTTPIRDQYLKLTDFTQLPDAPLTSQSKSEFVIFRQQLRDLFDVSDLSTVVWPIIPTSSSNIVIPPFPPIPKYNPDQNDG